MEKTKPTLLELLGVLVLALGFMALRFYVIIKMWDWLMVPMHMPALDIKHAFGVAMLSNVLVVTEESKELKGKSMAELAKHILQKSVGLGIALWVAYWLFG